jgi:hypothetical protein
MNAVQCTDKADKINETVERFKEVLGDMEIMMRRQVNEAAIVEARMDDRNYEVGQQEKDALYNLRGGMKFVRDKLGGTISHLSGIMEQLYQVEEDQTCKDEQQEELRKEELRKEELRKEHARDVDEDSQQTECPDGVEFSDDDNDKDNDKDNDMEQTEQNNKELPDVFKRRDDSNKRKREYESSDGMYM